MPELEEPIEEEPVNIVNARNAAIAAVGAAIAIGALAAGSEISGYRLDDSAPRMMIVDQGVDPTNEKIALLNLAAGLKEGQAFAGFVQVEAKIDDDNPWTAHAAVLFTTEGSADAPSPKYLTDEQAASVRDLIAANSDELISVGCESVDFGSGVRCVHKVQKTITSLKDLPPGFGGLE